MYRAKYICRLCGGVEMCVVTTSKGLAMEAAANAIVGDPDPIHGIPVLMFNQHSCPDGSLGIADFQGFVFLQEGEAQ